jgi:folylpolyglutamate synthase
MAFHTFIKENVTLTILETGVGGEYDATNVVEKPVATGITRLGIDHTPTLGSTLSDIAWHKSGIIKPGCSAFTVDQPPEAMQVLRKRATEKGSPLIEELHDLRLSCLTGTALTNASLALSLASTVIGSENIATYVSVLEQTDVLGRRQLLDQGDDMWYLDGAHNEVSLEAAAEWFAEATNR